MTWNAIPAHADSGLQTEPVFLTGEGAFVPDRSGLARVKVVGGSACSGRWWN